MFYLKVQNISMMLVFTDELRVSFTSIFQTRTAMISNGPNGYLVILHKETNWALMFETMLSITVLISTKYLGHKLVPKQNNGGIITLCATLRQI